MPGIIKTVTIKVNRYPEKHGLYNILVVIVKSITNTADLPRLI